MRRAALYGLATLLAAAVAAPAARAATITHVPGAPGVGFTADSGELNRVTVVRDGDALVYADPGANLEALGDCIESGDTVRCPAAGVTNLTVDLGDGDDEASVEAPTVSTFLLGRDGDDRITAGSGADVIVGGIGSDTLNGGAGDDMLTAEDVQNASTTSANVLDGGAGSDQLYGAAGADDLRGGDGDDRELRGFAGNDVVDGGNGADTLSGGDDNDTLRGGEGNDVLGLDARIGADGVPSERGDDVLLGDGGDDLLRPGLGPTSGVTDADVLGGGGGRDTVSYERRPDGISAGIGGGAGDGASGERDDIGLDVERLVGSAGDDALGGGPGGDELDGGPGNDTLDGGDGADTLNGGSGDAGNDELRGGSGVDMLLGNAGNDTLDGGDGSDTVMGGDDADRVTGGADNDTVSGGSGADALSGGSGDDSLDGGAVAVLLDGNDTIAGDAGDDRLTGGGGDDMLVGGAGVDDMTGGAGADMVDYGLAGAAVTVTLDDRANDGARGERDNVHVDIEQVGGGGREDTLTGSRGRNLLDGGSGEDYLDGAAQRDDLRGGRGQDVIRARDGVADTVNCGSGGGADFAIVDRTDRVRGCERAEKGRGQPTLGSDVSLQPSGTTNFSLPGMQRMVPLKDDVSVPLSTTIDVRKGRVALTAATTRRVRQRAAFYAGQFRVRQLRQGRRRARAITEVTLMGGSFRGCTRTASAAGPSRAASRRTIRRLWGSGKGRFRTNGRHSAATVRGTTWLVEDRCDGTLTRVVRGTVRVEDFARNRTVTVRAGQSYLARAQRAAVKTRP